MRNLIYSLLWLLSSSQTILGIGPLAIGAGFGAGIVSSVIYSGWDVMGCQFSECCGLPYVGFDVTKLESDLDTRIFGQHLVKSILTRALKAHLKKERPKKALVVSFHGMTGSGKNYVSKFVAESIYKEGLKSAYVHNFIATYHFPHPDKADIYKLQLQDWIRGNVSNCERSLFIFDEMDKLPEGMIDAIKPFIDHHEDVNGVDFRRSIFIFLSNTGGMAITKKVLEFWENGKIREDITYNDLEDLINKGAFNEKGGLHHSVLIEKSLVDFYIPFLPMEKSHVKKCIINEISDRNQTLSEHYVNQISNMLTYWPPELNLYSNTGCKRVSQKVDLILEEMLEDLNDEENY